MPASRSNPTVLVVTPEVTYLPEGIGNMSNHLTAKAGGLADVSAALISALFDQGADVHVVLDDHDTHLGESVVAAFLVGGEAKAVGADDRPVLDDHPVAQRLDLDVRGGLLRRGTLRSRPSGRALLCRFLGRSPLHRRLSLLRCHLIQSLFTKVGDTFGFA